MQTNDIQTMIEQGIEGCESRVTGDGYHFEAIVVSDSFVGKSLLQKQKMVYATLGDKITSGEIHALSIKAYTPEEWALAQAS